MGLFKNRHDNDIFQDMDDESLEVNTLDDEVEEEDAAISENITEEELEELEELLASNIDENQEIEEVLDDVSLKKKEMDDILSSLEEIENGSSDDVFEKRLFENRKSSEEDDSLISEESTIISKGTTIGGGINASGHLEIYGDVNGDVECRGKLTILGNVTGNASAAEVYINTSRFEGDIRSKGAVKIGVGTVVIGNVTGTSALIAGAIKGEVDIVGPTTLDSTAVVKGNVKAKSVQINNGAVLQGFCALAYSDVDIDDFFEAEEFK